MKGIIALLVALTTFSSYAKNKPDWVTIQKRKLTTTDVLGKANIPNQEFTNPNGSPIAVNYDYFYYKCNVKNPFPGPPLNFLAVGDRK